MNRFFHYKENGGTLKGEIKAGIGIFLLSVCGLFINMQLIAKLSISGAYAESNVQQISINGEYYALTWFLSMLIAFVGSLMIGLVARLPLVQVSGICASTVLVSMVGIETGLSYYNLLFVCVISSIVYTILMIIPGLKQFVFRALPQPVRKALPAAVGLLTAWIAIQLSGIVDVTESRLSIYGTGSNGILGHEGVMLSAGTKLSQYTATADKYHPLLLIGTISVIVTIAVYIIMRQKKKSPFLFSLITGTLFYLVASIVKVVFDWKTKSFVMDSLWGRLWMMGSEDAMQTHLQMMKRTFSFTRVLQQGSDFSAYKAAGGNVVLLFAIGILTFLFINMYSSDAVIQSVASDIPSFDADDCKSVQKVLLCNAVINIISPLIGNSPVQIGTGSVAGSRDGAKSGLASVVASIGFLISIFVWVVPFIFATSLSYKITFNMYGHYGTVMQLMAETGMVVADAVIFLVGISMVAGCLQQNWKDSKTEISFLTTVGGTFLFTNLAVGVALGSIAYVLTIVTGRRSKKNEKQEETEEITTGKELDIPQIVGCLLSVVLLLLLIR